MDETAPLSAAALHGARLSHDVVGAGFIGANGFSDCNKPFATELPGFVVTAPERASRLLSLESSALLAASAPPVAALEEEFFVADRVAVGLEVSGLTGSAAEASNVAPVNGRMSRMVFMA